MLPTRAFSPSLGARGALAATAGLLLTATYPPFALSSLAWIALTPLILALEGTSSLTSLGLGWLTGTILSLGVTGYWMFHAARDYFHLSTLGAGAFTIAVNQVFVALYWGLFGLAAAALPRRQGRWLLIPTVYVATEYGRAHLFSGNPWELLGHSQTALPLIQICDLTGVYGLSFLLVCSATAVVELGRTRLPALLTVLLVVLSLLYGNWRIGTVDASPRDPLRVVLVQGNLPNEQRGQPAYFAEHLARYLELTRTAAIARPALIVWPENAIGFFPQDNPSLLAHITDLLRGDHAALLAGAPRAADRVGVAAIYNSAYLFTADGINATYDKRILLPFVERTPLRAEDGPYEPGGEPTIFSINGTRIGSLICYEALYSELASDLAERGVQLLVNISNDSWFDAGAGPEQHFQMARFRAVENHVPLVRVTNSGVTGVFDGNGREMLRVPARTAAAQSIDVPIRQTGSFYSRHGDLFALACIAVAVTALGVRAMRVFTR